MIGSTWITLRNEQRVEYHPSIRYPRHIFQQLRQEDFQRLMRDRREQGIGNNSQNDNNASTASIQSINAEVSGLRDELRSMIQSVQVDNDARSQISAVSNITTNNCNSPVEGRTIMGGRNERANGRNLSQVRTIRRIQQTDMQERGQHPECK